MVEQPPLKCPNCQSGLFQEIMLGNLKQGEKNFNYKGLRFDITIKIFICSNCSYRIENIDDLSPREIMLHITGNSESRKRRSILNAGFEQKDYANWKSGLLCLDGHWFVVRKDYEQKNVSISAPAGCLIKTSDESGT